MAEHKQTIRWLLLTNCLSVSDHFVGIALKRLKPMFLSYRNESTGLSIELILKNVFTLRENVRHPGQIKHAIKEYFVTNV